jgi:hypothetical protein
MATEAIFNFLMDPLENSAGLLMVEIFRVEKNDGLFGSLMFRVTHDAVVPFIAMITSIFRNAFGYFLVTGQALDWWNFQILVMTLAAIFNSRGIRMSDTQFSWGIGNIILLLCPELQRHQASGDDH